LLDSNRPENTIVKIYEIDGTRFSTLDGFYEEAESAMSLSPWGHNLNAFNDILRGGFGTPDEGFTIRWKNHAVSKDRLGYSETVRLLGVYLERCHPTSRETVSKELEAAKKHCGPTAFDWIVEIIHKHGKGGEESQGNVELLLE
jgi:RNAse (barnase) inhibitor barstar